MTIIENITAHSILPVSLQRLHYWIRRDPTEKVDDQLYTSAIGAAGNLFEEQTDLALVSQRKLWKPWRFGDQNNPCAGREMKVPLGNTRAVEITYFDTDGVEQPFTDFYILKFSKRNDRIVLNTGVDWPSVDCNTEYPISIEFDCGWPVGEIWTAKAWGLGDIMQPTYLKPEWVAYEATKAGTSTDPEKKLSTKTGVVTADGPDLEWTCLGLSIPQVAAAAILNLATHYVEKGFVYLDYPNLNKMIPNWDAAVQACKLHW